MFYLSRMIRYSSYDKFDAMNIRDDGIQKDNLSDESVLRIFFPKHHYLTS